MIYDLIIIGGGPAGMAAGIYAARKKIKTLLITDKFGGQSLMAADIQNFIGWKSISGWELAKKMEEHLRLQPEIEIKENVSASGLEKKDNGFIVKTDKGEIFETKTLLLALGSHYRKLNVPGEDQFRGRGVFYCTTCDAPFMKNKIAAVVGGGNAGFESTLDLLPYAVKIYLLEYADVLKADPITREKAKSSGKVEIITLAEVKEVFGDQFVKGLKYQNRQTNEVKELAVEGVFVAIGYQPSAEIAKNLAALNQKGEIIVDPKTQQTNCPGVWAAGDITDGLYRQYNIAIGDAIKAVLNIYEYLKK
jgi:alkyl hydroperoxide reductase subunit F